MTKMDKKIQIKKILFASILVGILQLIYNLFVVGNETSFIKVLPTLFEGTFMFVIVGVLFIYLTKKDIFKNWILFGTSLSLVHSLFMLIPLGFNFIFLISLFIAKFIAITISIKFIDYIIKN